MHHNQRWIGRDRNKIIYISPSKELRREQTQFHNRTQFIVSATVYSLLCCAVCLSERRRQPLKLSLYSTIAALHSSRSLWFVFSSRSICRKCFEFKRWDNCRACCAAFLCTSRFYIARLPSTFQILNSRTHTHAACESRGHTPSVCWPQMKLCLAARFGKT